MKKGIKVLAIGAVLWDVINEKDYIGGAPFNFAVNMARLGGNVAFVTSVGKDDRGERAIAKIKEYNVSDGFVQISDDCFTGYAKATIDANGNAVYDIPYAAFDDIRVDDGIIAKINEFAPDLIYIGSFEQRNETTREAIKAILSGVRSGYVFFDINIRMNFADKEVLGFGFEKSNIVKLNEEESKLVSNLFYGEELDEKTFADRLRGDYGIECLIVTLGEKGCRVYCNDGCFEGKPIPAEGGDTIGAGDAFSGAFAASYLSGEGAQKAADKGNLLGSYVASRRGALPDLDGAILDALLKG